ncbi:MAG: hypothetical protein DHS20C18_28680 [Saprospiraceae bacterium]|nr:MAG: hypothetical protein DHS20C18_28680 [Saprospiraceae bacterium]
MRSQQFYQGFLTPFEGERLDFLQNLQDNSVALLVRAKDGTTFIEFEGEPMPNVREKYVTFMWEMALAKHTGKSNPIANFDLLVNGQKLFQFNAVQESNDPDWVIRQENGAELAFVKSLIDKKGGDVFGFMFLTLPRADYEAGKSVRIKIIGGNSNSPDWYMAFQNVVKTTATAAILPALAKQDGQLKQPVELKYNHLGINTTGEVMIAGLPNTKVQIKPGENEYTLYLDTVETAKPIKVTLKVKDKEHTFDLTQKPVRAFDVYFLPHSHIDIGFTHLQKEVEQMQWRNFEEGIALAEKTKDYPEEARYKWNVEIMWAVDSYLKNADENKRKQFIEAVKNGWIGLDALFGSELTGLQREEELMHITDAANDFEASTGVTTQTAMITDVPGYSWGIVPALAKNGVKYFSIGPNHMPHLANGGYQVGNTFNAWADIPFYWTSPSGKDKVLFWMSGHGYSWFHDWLLGTLNKSGGTPILKFLNELDNDGYPYDIVQLRYTMGDNAGPDTGMPDFVRDWNEKYAYPKFRIATTAQMFEAFEERYGDQLPTHSGDFSPYWEDGAASSAVETGINRNTADRLVQAEALWAMNKTLPDFPHEMSANAWQNVLLFSEHTWGAISSKSDPDGDFTKDQWAVKQGFALKADSLADVLLEQALPTMEGAYDYFQVYNTSSWTRSDLVSIPSRTTSANEVLLDENKNEVVFQVLKNGEIVFIAKEVKPFSSKKYYFKKRKKKSSKSEQSTTGNILRSKNLTMRIGKNGTIESILQKGNANDLIDAGSKFGFNEYWYTGLNAENPRKTENATIKPTESGPILSEITITSDAPGAKKVFRKIRLIKDLDRIDIENTVDKLKELKDENVRYSFPFNIADFTTRIDQAYHVLIPDKNQLKGANKNFFCAQRFVDFSNENYGVTVANLDAPLVEMGAMLGQDWMKDMRNRPWLDKHQPSTTLFSWVMNNAWFVNYKGFQEGLITSRYRIMPHQKWSDADRKKFGIAQSQPLLVVPATKKATTHKPLLQIIGADEVIVTSLKPAKDGKGIIVKLLNAVDHDATFSLQWQSPKAVYRSNNKEAKGDQVGDNLKLSAWEFLIIRAE